MATHCNSVQQHNSDVSLHPRREDDHGGGNNTLAWLGHEDKRHFRRARELICGNAVIPKLQTERFLDGHGTLKHTDFDQNLNFRI